MKINHQLSIQTRLIGIIIICFVFNGINTVNAQGWTFVPTLHSSCPYTSTAASQVNAILNGFSSFGIPTKSQCETLRQYILSVKVNMQLDEGGTCSLYYTCTECAGSDMAISSDITSIGSVSLNALTQGNAFFSSHPSFGFEDWYNNNVLKLKSMGIDFNTYFSGNGMFTDNMDFNKSYADQVSKFENTNDGTIYLTGKEVVDPNVLKNNPYGTSANSKDYVRIPSLPELENQNSVIPLKSSYVPPLTEIKNDKIESYQNPYVEIGLNIAKTATDIYAPGLVGTGLKAGFNLLAEDANALIGALNGEPCPSTATILSNAFDRTKDDVKEQIDDVKEQVQGAIEDYGESKALYAAKYIGIKSGIKPLNIYNAVKTYEKYKKIEEKIEEMKDNFETGYDIGTDIKKAWKSN